MHLSVLHPGMTLPCDSQHIAKWGIAPFTRCLRSSGIYFRSPGLRNRNGKLQISRAPTKGRSQKPAYSQALNQNKIDRQRSRSRVRQADSKTAMVDGVWS